MDPMPTRFDKFTEAAQRLDAEVLSGAEREVVDDVIYVLTGGVPRIVPMEDLERRFREVATNHSILVLE